MTKQPSWNEEARVLHGVPGGGNKMFFFSCGNEACTFFKTQTLQTESCSGLNFQSVQSERLRLKAWCWISRAGTFCPPPKTFSLLCGSLSPRWVSAGQRVFTVPRSQKPDHVLCQPGSQGLPKVWRSGLLLPWVRLKVEILVTQAVLSLLSFSEQRHLKNTLLG